ncbi:MAG: CysS/YqeB C-terminal domain-containing protein, partial [Actinomycetota bacterium]
PGWHIECSAMSIRHLGETFDIHTGGQDLVFPHHEDEIAQSEGAVGHEVIRYWSHGHHLLSEGKKMAKSARNYYTLEDVTARGIDPLAFRYLALQTRYRAQMNFTWESLQAAERGLEKLRKQMVEWSAGPANHSSEQARALDRRFCEAISDDLDTPQALVAVSELAAAPIDPGEKFHLLARWDSVLGLELTREISAKEQLPPGVAEKIEAREAARKARDWDGADRIRSELAELGIELIDTPAGTRWVIAH